MQQNNNEISTQHQFDAYCKKVLRNEAKSIRKRNDKIKENEEPLNDLNEGKYSQTHLDEQDVYFLFGMEILISDRSYQQQLIGYRIQGKRLFYFIILQVLMILRSVKFST